MKRLAVAILAMMVLASMGLRAQEPARLLKAAMNAELVDGDLKTAIEQYKKVVETGDRPLAAQALIRMAECYQKLGDSEAQKIYERVMRDFADQSEWVAVARARLRGTSAQARRGVTLKALPDSSFLPGAVSPDGRYLTFASWDDGNLYVRDLRTGTDRALTQRNDFNIGVSTISPDATFVAYQSYGRGCDGKQGGLPALCLVSLADKGLPTSKVIIERQDILEIAPMGWSPDGRKVAVSLRRQDHTAQVGLVTLADGSVRVLQSVDWRGPTHIFFSPDGRDVVFDLPVSDASDDRDIVMLAVDGSRGLTAVEHPSQDIVMGWTPDGSKLLFASDRGGTMGLWAQSFAERQPQGAPNMVRGNLGGAWSLGVTKEGALYFGVRNNNRDIFVTTVDLAAGKQLTSPVRPIRRFVGTNIMPDWSSDGKYLAYVSQRGFDPTNNTGRMIGIYDLTTGEERELHPKLLYFGPISWSPDGAALLTAGTDVKGRAGVFTIDARTADVSLVVEGSIGSYPKWSRDGKHVFYRKGTSEQSTDSSIVERDIASGAERKVVSGRFSVFSVSPDGRSIVAPVRATAGGAAGGVVQIGVDDGEVRYLFRQGPSEEVAPFVAPEWTPDSRAVLVHMRSPNELWLVPTTGALPRKLNVDVRDWSFGPGKMSVHPDGRRIAFLSGSLTGEVVVLENFLPIAKEARR